MRKDTLINEIAIFFVLLLCLWSLVHFRSLRLGYEYNQKHIYVYKCYIIYFVAGSAIAQALRD